MKIKTKIMCGIVFLVFVSFAYAGVLEYYGKIVGNANVEGPIFYADFSQGKLLINVLPSESNRTSFNGSNSFFIYTDDITTTNFSYKVKCVFSVKAWSNQDNQKLKLYCRYHNNESWVDICSTDIVISTSPSVITASCSSQLDALINVTNFGYRFEGQSKDMNVAYYIESNPQGDTKFQVTSQ